MAKQGRRGNQRPLIIRREEDRAESAHGGAWKVAYADFVTAMMAFFLLMWLLNATTEDQRKGLADYFSPSNLMSHASSGTGQAFGGHTAFDHGALVSDRGSVQVLPGVHPVPAEPSDDPDAIPEPARRDAPAADTPRAPPASSAAQLRQSPASQGNPEHLPLPAAAEAAPSPDAAAAAAAAAKAADRAAKAAAEQGRFERAAADIRQAVAADPALAALAGQIAVDVTPAGLRIQLLDQERQAMFATGSATPSQAVKLLIDKITPMLLRLRGQISIQGHTDAAPYPGPERTNWELSAERANAARRMLAEAGLPDARIRDVTGRADHDLLLPAQPLAPANRRIAITVLRGPESPPPASMPPG